MGLSWEFCNWTIALAEEIKRDRKLIHERTEDLTLQLRSHRSDGGNWPVITLRLLSKIPYSRPIPCQTLKITKGQGSQTYKAGMYTLCRGTLAENTFILDSLTDFLLSRQRGRLRLLHARE